MKDKLIAAGVKNLRAYGYPECDKDNILTEARSGLMALLCRDWRMHERVL